MKYGKSDVSDNENPDEDAASVEEDYNVDIVNSEADLGIWGITLFTVCMVVHN